MNTASLLSRAAREMKPSIIRALLKIVQNSDIISFAGGAPDASLFPLELFAELSRKVVLEQGRAALQYGETQGWKPLREQVAAYLRSRGLAAEPEAVVITTGSQQAIDLICRVLLDPGDAVAMEDPGYLGALSAFRNYGARVLGLPMDQDGLLPEALEQALDRGEHPKFLYLTPTYQNPSGRLLSPPRRRRVAEIAAARGLLLVEDDPYGEICFEGAPLPPLAAEPAAAGCAVYLGTFSKIGVPGLRLGWAAGPAELIARMTLAKETADVSAGVLAQAVAAEFFKGGHLRPHLQTLRATYRGRAMALLQALRIELGQELEVEEPKGGFFLWAALKHGLSGQELFPKALEAGVAYVPGAAFHIREGEGASTLRLTFCTAGEERIREGVRRLAGVVRQACAGVGRAPA